MKKTIQLGLIFEFVALLFSTCTIRYPTSDESAVPVLSNLMVTKTLYLQSDIDYSLSVDVSDPQGLNDIETVIGFIYPLNQSASLWEDTLQDQGIEGDIIPGDGRFFRRFTVDFAEGQVGQYRLEVIANDRSSHQSNALLDTLTVVDDQKNFPPVLSHPFVADTLTEASLKNVFISVQVEDAYGKEDIDSVFFQIYPSFNPNFFLHYTLRDNGLNGDEVADDGIYSLLGDLSDTLRTIGIHLIRFQAIDQAGLISQPLVLYFYIEGINGPPVLSQLSIPDTVSRYAYLPFLISVRADDPQGLADVKKVYFNMINPDDTPFEYNPVPLYDDGNYGDQIPGDGLFSISVLMSSQTDKGIYQFRFFAEDYAQVISDSLTHRLTVVD
ncbi:hypothetical protein JW824_14705 [bacterium]|nr:hypothetical protein [bacterium]RQV93470.1 MAG: hypothetical protein EH221_09600 [bacterium]